MADKQIFEPEKLSIHSFNILKGSVENPEDFCVENIKEFSVENLLKLAFNLQDSLVKAEFQVKIKAESNKKKAVGDFHIVFIYKVENLDQLAIPDKDELIILNPSLGNALAAITYSTARGVLLIKLQGTALQNFVLPIINPNDLL